MPPMEVRPLAADDVDAVVRVWNATKRDTYDFKAAKSDLVTTLNEVSKALNESLGLVSEYTTRRNGVHSDPLVCPVRRQVPSQPQ